MAEEEINFKEVEEEGEISVGGENVLEPKEIQDEIKPVEKQLEEPTLEDEPKEAILEHEPNETGGQKSSRGEFEVIKEQDISQYLWDTLLKYVNKFNQWLYNKSMDAIDRGLSKHERGPAKSTVSKEEKTKHTTNRGKELFNLRESITQDYSAAITDDFMKQYSNLKEKSDRDAFKNLLVKSQGIAYDMVVSELLHEKMSKDKNFDFANMDTKSLIGEVNSKIRGKQERLMTGILATSFYSENIEGMSPREALKACDEYLKIRENENTEIKKLITKDLDQGNFAANDKRPSKDIGVKLNAYARSFDNDAGIVNSSLQETVSVLEKSTLSEEEKVSLAEFQKTANLFQKFEAGTVLDLQRQIKAVDEAYKANRNSPLRARIAAIKKTNGLSPVAMKIEQKYGKSAILQAAARTKGGRK